LKFCTEKIAASGLNVIKLFGAINVTGNRLSPSLIFVSKAVHTQVERQRTPLTTSLVHNNQTRV